MRWGLFSEILVMSWDTISSIKLRSGLTVLGIVIGITSIVGITSLLRGFEESFKDLIRQIGPDTVFVQKFSGIRSEEHTSELQSLAYLVCRLLLEKKKNTANLKSV